MPDANTDTNANAAVVVDGVSRRFWRTVAIDDVSLTVHKGELFGVLGPDGAGKTTLLRMMAAVLDPSGPEDTSVPAIISAIHDPAALRRKIVARLKPPTGHIAVAGYDTVADAEAVKARLGYMPQNFGLYDDLSVEENLTFAADVFGLKGPTRVERIRDLLAFADLEQFRARRVRLLSGGMKKKLALACALLHRPAVLLLDEPTTGVDPVARRDFWDLLSGLHAEGITAVVSTPYMDEAERCNRVALLFEGSLLACDTPEAIKSRVPGYALRVTLRDADDIRAAQDALQGLPGLLEIQTYGDRLSLIVSAEVEDALRVVRNRLKNKSIPIETPAPTPVRMEEAFIYMVGAARQQQAEREQAGGQA